MHTRLNVLLSRSQGRVDAAARRRRRLSARFFSSSTFLTNTEYDHVLSTTSATTQNRIGNHNGNHNSNYKYTNQLNRIRPASYSNFRYSSSSAGAAHDESLLNQDIENLTNACFSQILPDEIFYKNDEDANNINTNKPLRTIHSNNNNNSHSLDQELGIDTIWDPTFNNEDNSIEGDFNLENEQNSSSDYIVEENQTNSSHETNNLNDSDSFNNGSTSTGTTSVMEMLRNFDPLKPPEVGGDPEKLQLWLECFSQRETVIRHQELVKKARDRKAFDSMSLMQRHVVQWFQGLQDAISIRQKEFLSNQDKRRASNRYGPFLCSLHPDKMAVIISQEAITQALLNGGKRGKDGMSLVRMARAIGTAVEMEVVSQRRIKERYHITKSNESSDEDPTDEEGAADDVSSGGSDDEKTTEYAIDTWTFSASHLKLYFEDLKRMGMGKNKRSIQYAMNRAKKAMTREETWTSDDLTHLGAALLSILTEHTKVNENGKEEPAFRVEKRWSHNNTKSTSFITIHDRLHKMFLEDDYLSWAANTTRHMPMIVPPSPWTGPNTGGYRWLEVEMMRTHRSNVQKEALLHADLSTVCDGLNVLGKTSWKINQEILEIGEYCWENNIPIGDIPSRVDFEIPSEPIYPASFNPEAYADKENPENKIQINALQSFRDSTTKRQRILQKNMDLRSLRCSAILKLNQAKKFKDFEKIYFPYNLDFRGRAYPVPPHLSNVGSDLCRGMLTFSEEKPLGKRGLYWLKVHLANFAGKNKMSFDDRSDFVDDNMENVRECAADPFSGNKWWMELDDPFQGLATCREIIRAIDSGNPETYMCSLSVHMDGSCNGLQHYAAIGRDTVGGKAVNLLEGDGPEDVYVGVMHEVIRRVKEEAALDVAFDNDDDTLDSNKMKSLKNNKAAKLINGLIDRGVVKRTVMTSVYGVTYIGARQQIQEKIEEKVS